MVKRSLSPESNPFHRRLPDRCSITVKESVEILAFQTPGGQIIRLLPMALATVIEETPGVERFQAIQTTPEQLTVRLQATGDAEVVWMAVRRRVQAYLASQGLETVAVERADEPPAPNPRSGKFRHIWAELRAQELTHVR
jgi:hypothetical protein